LDRLILFLASGFYSGYAPIASGTVGTLVGIALYYLLSRLPLYSYSILTVVIIALGVWLASRAEEILGEKDPSVIVIDEIAGFLVAMWAFPSTWRAVVAGFLLFRFFDILKPFPIRKIDQHAPGGWGVMLDDVLAGVYANIALRLIWQWGLA
jgi:phosphatidylglycerophosphatase A